MSKKPSKRICQSHHARHRAYQRFDVHLNRFDRREIVQMIQKGKGIMIEKQSNRISRWRVVYAGRLMDVIYDKHRKNIVTFLNSEIESK